MRKSFQLKSPYKPMGDQPKAIQYLCEGLEQSYPHQTLLGITGSGKTYTMAQIIARSDRPGLIIAHNKTLAAQLYREFKSFFPDNSVHYFVSYYDYYQPEAYIYSSDTYIEKDASINEELDRMRHAATRALFERRDVIIVSSVSCIYGLGAPADYLGLMVKIEKGQIITRRKLLEKLVERQYSRNDQVLSRGKFRVRGDSVDIWGVGDDEAIRICFFGDEIDDVMRIDPLRNTILTKLDQVCVFPASHYVTYANRWPSILQAVREELKGYREELHAGNKLLEEQRLVQRTEFDLEMLELTGYCNGIENYSRHLTGRNPGEPPPTLLDYLPEDAIVFIDESHVTVPQIHGMYRGDRSRKTNLVQHGFRLKSALDNRPLTFQEFSQRVHQLIYVSATPADYEINISGDRVVEQLIRPTGLLDPVIQVHPATGQVDNLYDEIHARVQRGEKILVTTLTKKMAESLTEYYIETGLKVSYLHSDIKTIDRVKIIRDLRLGKYDCLIGINLLREGLDIPEVSLVAIMDADQEGFLRSTTSLIQTIGRCARHVSGTVILYADKITRSMKAAMNETQRRREQQMQFNAKYGITPSSIKTEISDGAFAISAADYITVPIGDMGDPASWTLDEIDEKITDLEKEMRQCARELKFEEAARFRDKIKELRQLLETGTRKS